MKLKKFLAITGTNPSEFSKRLDVPYSTFLTYVKGTSEPSLSNAIKIEDMTLGAVKVRDMVIKKDKGRN